MSWNCTGVEPAASLSRTGSWSNRGARATILKAAFDGRIGAIYRTIAFFLEKLVSHRSADRKGSSLTRHRGRLFRSVNSCSLTAEILGAANDYFGVSSTACSLPPALTASKRIWPESLIATAAVNVKPLPAAISVIQVHQTIRR
jgi:hypothetical protein